MVIKEDPPTFQEKNSPDVLFGWNFGLHSLEDERRVDVAEGEVVALDELGVDPALLARDVVEFAAFGINVGEVDGRAEPAFAHHLDGKPGLDRTAGAERVAEEALEG